MKPKIILVLAIVAGITFWVVDAFLDYYFFYNASFFDLLLWNIPGHEKYVRMIMLGINFIFGLILYIKQNQYLNKQKEVFKTKERLKITLNSIGDAVIATDVNKIITEINPIAQNLTGWTESEAIGKPLKNVFIIINSITRERVEDPVEKVLQTGKIIGLANHTSLISRNSQEYQIADSGAPIIDESGKVYGVILVFRDISENYKNEIEIENSEKKFRNIFEHSHLGKFIYHLNDQNELIFTNCNLSASNILGIDCNQFIGLKMEDAFPTLAKTELPEKYIHVATTGESYYNQQVDYDEKEIKGAFEVHVIQIIQNYIVVNFEDITEKLQTREKLYQSEKKFRKIIESSPFGMHMYKLVQNDLIFIGFNPAADRILGVTHDQFLNKKILEVFPSLVDTKIPSKYKEIAKTGMFWSTEQINYQDDKIISAFKVNAFQVFVGVMVTLFEDITPNKQLEAEKLRLIKVLETINSEMEHFTYTVSHDLRSPLITIKGLLGVMMNEIKEGKIDNFESYAKKISNATDTLKFLLEDLLELSRMGRMVNQISDIDINELINKVVEILQGSISKSNVKIKINQNLPTIKCDFQRLSDVFQNLIENAIKFMGEQDNKEIEIGYLINNNSNIYFVKDNGIGIEKKYVDKIFGLFDKLDKNTEGNGVGLALVKRIVEFYNGSIWVESEGLGKGTTFYFTINLENND